MPERRGPSAADIAAASEMSAEDRAEMIRGMVNGLSDRLATDGGPPPDWARLITALGVLGETDRARAIAAEAREVFADDAGALAVIADAEARLP
jgi:cytochrome c-type biogenesis protein CcmH